jgi:hypothetical protein
MKMQPYGCFSFAPGMDGHPCLGQKGRKECMMPEDVHCLVCGEPWDRWGLTHGDVTAEEATAFLRGEGCPACAYGTRQHGQNTNPRPGILAQRVLAEKQKAGQALLTEESPSASVTGAPAFVGQQQPIRHTLQECQQIALAIGWTIQDLGRKVYFYSSETFGAYAVEDEDEGFNEMYDALDYIQQRMQGSKLAQKGPGMVDIRAVRAHFRPNEKAFSISPLRLIYQKLYQLALRCSSSEEFLAKAKALPEEERPDDQYWRNLFIEHVEKGEIEE